MAVASEAATSSFQTRLANVRYADKEYWNNRYQSQTCEFDWFYGYTALRKIVHSHVKRTKPVLHVGCGNSNFQEGMAKDGYQVINTDISEVVIEQMRSKHAHIPQLQYVLSDCRSMPEFLDCQFGSVIDKGTVDALLCSRDAAEDIRNMFREVSRVLVPGGVFLLITLGGPDQRLSLVNRPEFDWSVQVCLVRRVPEDQYAPSEPGRAIPLNDTVKPLSYMGPLEVQPDGTIAGLPEPFDPASFFYAYVCRRSPLVLLPDNTGGEDGKVRFPAGWKATVRAVAALVGGELKLPKGILGRGRRVRTTSRATFERELQERELEHDRERRAALAAHESFEQQLGPDLKRHSHSHLQQQQQSHHPEEQQQQRPQAGSGMAQGGADGRGDEAPEGRCEWSSRELGGGPQEGEAGRGRDGDETGNEETRRRALLDPLVGTADDVGPSDGAAAAAEDVATGGTVGQGSGIAAAAAAAASAIAAPATDDASAAAAAAAAMGQPPYGAQARAAPGSRRPASSRGVSYRRLSVTVQDEFAFLDAVDGTGCTSGGSNVLDAAAAAGGDDDREDTP